MALEGFLEILVILPEMHGRWHGLASLEVCSKQRGKDLSLGGIFIFTKEPPRASFGVSKQWCE